MQNSASISKAQGNRGWLILLLALVGAVGASVWCLRVDPTSREVKQTVAELENYERALEAVSRFGPAAYPALGRLLRGHDTVLSRWYDQLRAMAPPALKRRLPRRDSKDELRRRTKQLVCQMGPAAARGLLSPIHDSLKYNDEPGTDQQLLGCLYWSIPESSRAVEALHEWMAKPDPYHLVFGGIYDDEMALWQQLPQFAPLLAAWLKLPDQALEAALALRQIGPPAACALPELIDTFLHGAAGHLPNTNAVQRFSPETDRIACNRAAAMAAMGKIGVASKEVFAVVEQGLSDPEPAVRAASAQAIGDFGFKAVSLWPSLVASLDTTNRLVLEYQIAALGRIGPAAQGAVPALEYWIEQTRTDALDTPTPSPSTWKWMDDPLPLPGGAAIALLEVAPAAAPRLEEIIRTAFSPDLLPNTHQALVLIKPLQKCAPQIVSALEPMLTGRFSSETERAAILILALQRDHPAARACLKEAIQRGPASSRSEAALSLWRATAQIKDILPVFEQLLGSTNQDLTATVQSVAELGPAAKPLVPELARLTTREEPVRRLAWKALRRIEPSALPMINEQ